MAQPASRQELIDYALRQNGAPVLEVNVAEEQLQDLMDDAIQYYQERHYDGITKIFLKYNIRRTPLEPFTTFELFFKDSEFKKWRYTLGLSHPFLKQFDIDVFYRLQQSFNTNNPKQLHILGLGIEYNF